MNILPKKSWHVRTKKNIERVKRDEAEAERLAKIEQDRVLHVEQEARIRELRRRAGIEEPAQTSHINLFEDFKDHQQVTNKDYEEEKKQDEARWQQKMGLTNKLVRQGDSNPWYCNTTSLLTLDGTESKKPAKTDLITSMYDPMIAIKNAEDIVRARRQEKNNIQPPVKSGRIEKHSVDTSQRAIDKYVKDDSSPEIVKIVKRSREKSDKKVKKEKRKKSKKHSSKSHKHHHKHHHRHRDESRRSK